MAIIVDMPRLSDTMEEGTLAGWLKKVGDEVKAGDGIAEIETDKAVMVFESFDKGTLLAIVLDVGVTVPIGTPMAILGKAGEDVTALVAECKAKVAAAMGGAKGEAAKEEAPKAEPVAAATAEAPKAEPVAAPKAEAPKAEAPKADAPDDAAPEPEAPKVPAKPAKAPVVGGGPLDKHGAVRPDLSAPRDEDGARVSASPLARRLAGERGIELSAVLGTGPHGRIVLADLEGLKPSRRLSGRLGKRVKREDEVVRVTQMRKTIAKRLTASMQEAPHYYLTIEVDASRLVGFRADVNAALELKGEKLKVSYNDLVMRACVVALEKHPKVNVAWEGATIRQFGGVHIGFAVALSEGLITPVVKDAESLDIFELSAAVKELAGRARDNKLEGHEYAGNSFCVSNLGMFGIDHFTAVINPPAACILAVGALVEAPVVRNGLVVAGHRLTMTMSADHRAVDGATGAAFLQDLRKVLEAPTSLIL